MELILEGDITKKKADGVSNALKCEKDGSSSKEWITLVIWQMILSVMEQPLVLSHLILSTILLNKLSILFHSIIVWPCG